MSQEMILIVAIGAVLVLGLLYLILQRSKAPAPVSSTLPLQLQAYERLVILAERIGLRQLISSLPSEGLSTREYQATLIESIKREFEYNVSQQIYVSPKAWEAVQSLKEQNIYVVNQLSSYLPAGSTGKDLGKAIVEYLSSGEHAGLQQVVTEALNVEAKKLIH